MSNIVHPDWIAVDWGTSNLRAFAIAGNKSIIASKQSDCGMGSLQPRDFEPVLLRLISDWLAPQLTTPVYICGMAGARQGWQDAGYRSTPCQPADPTRLTTVTVKDSRISVMIIPGVCQHEPADVMRGEETQLAGLLEINPNFSGTVCLPGTHSKWVILESGVIKRFTTYLTGEMFSLLCKDSVLKHSVNGQGHDDQAFLSTAIKVIEGNATIPDSLFGLRASSLLNDLPADTARSSLSGLLIGQELAAARRYWTNLPVTVIGDDSISRLYTTLLTELGCKTTAINAEEITIAGLATIANKQSELTQ